MQLGPVVAPCIQLQNASHRCSVYALVLNYVKLPAVTVLILCNIFATMCGVQGVAEMAEALAVAVKVCGMVFFQQLHALIADVQHAWCFIALHTALTVLVLS